MDRARQTKVRRFEEFVDERLKPDLSQLITERDKVFEHQKTFLDLKKNIKNLKKNAVTTLRTMVNLGAEVYMQADVPNTQRIFLDIPVKEARLAKQIEEYTHLIASVKAEIKLVCEGIRKLLEIPSE